MLSSPLHHPSGGPPLPRFAGAEKSCVLATSHVRVLLYHYAISKFAPREGAERREAHAKLCPRCANKCTQFAPLICYAAARFFRRGALAFRRSRWRHSPPATTPMAQPQNRVSSRRGAKVFCPFAASALS